MVEGMQSGRANCLKTPATPWAFFCEDILRNMRLGSERTYSISSPKKCDGISTSLCTLVECSRHGRLPSAGAANDGTNAVSHRRDLVLPYAFDTNDQHTERIRGSD